MRPIVNFNKRELLFSLKAACLNFEKVRDGCFGHSVMMSQSQL